MATTRLPFVFLRTVVWTEKNADAVAKTAPCPVKRVLAPWAFLDVPMSEKKVSKFSLKDTMNPFVFPNLHQPK